MYLLVVVALFAFLHHVAIAVSLPDTTIVSCYDASGVNTTGVEKDGGTFPRQDCRYGFDPAALAGSYTKIGGGEAGFDYTALNAAGNPTAPSPGPIPPAHSCVRDNITGLVWEVKVNDGSASLRDYAWTYTWYNSDLNTNGFGAGIPSGGTCKTAGRCDTEKYVADVNATGLCGFSDWRMPTVRELFTISNEGGLCYGGQGGCEIDPTFFPNTFTPCGSNCPYYWSATPHARYQTNAWTVFHGFFNQGGSPAPATSDKSSPHPVRLVRGPKF